MENEESNNQDNSCNLDQYKLEKSRSHYIRENENKDNIGNLNHKINKIKSLDVNKKKRNNYVI